MKAVYTRKPPVAIVTASGLAFEVGGPLDLADTLYCGQAFRWRPCGDGSFSGVVGGEIVRATLEGTRLLLAGTTPSRAKFWSDYFALDVDYTAIQKTLRRNPVLRRCIEFAPGIRVLRQDFYEMLITFMISQNNNIPRIKGIVERMSQEFGRRLGQDFDGRVLYSFPEPHTLASLKESDLAPLRAGYRVAGILAAARRVASGELDECQLQFMPLDEARACLLETHGVGPKIADCVLLYGLGRFESFPVDVWIRRAMAVLFPDGLPRTAADVAGIAQQYIFHHARTTGLQ